MSDVGMHSPREQAGAFKPATMLAVIAMGAVAFLAILVLGAFAPDLRSGHNGGSHALSNAATGFSGIVRLARDTGHDPVIVRSENQLASEDLAVITPEHGYVDLSDIMNTRGPRVTLLVLPKWQTVADQQNRGWVRVPGLLPPADPARTLSPDTPFSVSRERGNSATLRTLPEAAPPELVFHAPIVLQTIKGKQIEPVIVGPGNRIVLGKVKSSQTYILADPDLLNNHGMADEGQARAALALLDYLTSTGAKSILFDVTANGLGGSRSPLRLAFEPPFLAVTLTIFAAMLLSAWQALVRFGPVRRRERAIEFGKAALVDNSAALIRKAGREVRLGSRYVDVIRERAVQLFRLPASDPQTLAARLEALNPSRSFAAASDAVDDARSRQELVNAAQSLNRWFQEIQR
jgi:hypothetical protein